MEDDTVDIYGDINDFDLGNEVERFKTENKELRERIRTLEGDLEKLASTIENMKKSDETLKKNMSTLYLTAKAEIDRKDAMISDLRSRIDDICFRRFTPDIQNEIYRGDNISEGNIAKRFKYDDNVVIKTNIDGPNDKLQTDSMHLEEIKEDVSDNAPKICKYEVDRLKNKQFDDQNRDDYKSRSKHSREREDITGNKFGCDNKRRREEFDDRFDVRQRSRSRPRDRYNDAHRSRSRSGSSERNPRYIENRGSRYNNDFLFRGEKARIEDRENWTDNRDTWRKHDNRDVSSRDSRGEYSRAFDRTDAIKREALPPSYEKDRNRNESEKTKQGDKLEKAGSKIERDSRSSKNNTLSDSVRRRTSERTNSENENATKVKPEKKRLKMLEKVEMKIRQMRATPIKKNNSTSEQTLSNNVVKEVSRNMTQELERKHGKTTLNKVASVLPEKEKSIKMKHSKERISQQSKMEDNKRDSFKKEDVENIVCISLSDEENSYKGFLDEDLIVIDECSNSVAKQNVSNEANNYFDSLSEDEITQATIQDVRSSIKYYTERVIPFQLSKDLPESSELDVKLVTEVGVKQEKKYINQNVNVAADKFARTVSREKEQMDKGSLKEELPNALYQVQRLPAEDFKKDSNRRDALPLLCVRTIIQSTNMAAENVVQDKIVINSPPRLIEEWNEVDLHEKRNINISSDVNKLEGGNVKNIAKEDIMNENKKKIKILSNIDVTPPINRTVKVVKEQSTNGRMNAENQPKVRDVQVINEPANLSFDADANNFKKKPNTNMENFLSENVLATVIVEDDSIEVIDSFKRQDMDNTEKSSIVNLNTSNSTKAEKIKTKQQHKSLLKEYITNHAKQNVKTTVENLIEEEKHIKLSKQVVSSNNESLKINSDTVDKKKATKEKIENSPKEGLAHTLQEDITIEEQNEEKENVIQFKEQSVNVTKNGAKEIKKKSLPNIIDEENIVKKPKQTDVDNIEECLNVNLGAQNTTEYKKKATKEKIKSSPKEDLKAVKDITIRNKNEDKDSVIQFKKQDINVNEKKEEDLNKKQNIDSIDESSNVNIDAQNATKNKKRLSKEKVKSSSKEDLTNTIQDITVENKNEKKESVIQEQDVDSIDQCSNVNLDAQNATKNKKRTSKEKIKGSPKEDLTNNIQENKKGKIESVNQFKKQYVNVNEKKEEKKIKKTSLPNLTEEQDMEMEDQNKNGNKLRKKDGINKIEALDVVISTKNFTEEERKESNKKMKNPSLVNLSESVKHQVKAVVEESTTEKKRDIKKSSKHERKPDKSLAKYLPSATKRMKPTIEEETEDCKHSKKRHSGASRYSANEDLAKGKKKVVKKNHLSKENLTNSSKKGKNLMREERRENYEKKMSNEKKKSPTKKYVSNVEGSIKEERKNMKENKTRPVDEKSLDLKKEPSKKTRRSPKENLSSTAHKTIDLKTRRSPKDLTNTGKLETGEKKHSKMQVVNGEHSSMESDVENTSRDEKKKKKGMSKEFTSTSEDTKNVVKEVKKVIDSMQIGDENTKEGSKEHMLNVMEVEDKIRSSRDRQKGKVVEKPIDIPDMSRKDEKYDRKNEKTKHRKENKTCSVIDAEKNSKASSTYERKTEVELQNTETTEKPWVVTIESNYQIPPYCAWGIKQNREEDSKGTVDTESSEETVRLKIMKFSDLRNILRGSLEEYATRSNSTEINAKGTKRDSRGLEHGDKYSAKESKKNDPEAVKNEKSINLPESEGVRKSKECVSDSSMRVNTIESGQAGDANSFEQRFYALIGSYSEDSDVVGTSGSVNSSMEKENENEGENIVKRTKENETCDFNREEQTETDKCDEIETKPMQSISDTPKSDVDIISGNSCTNKSNQTPVNKNIQNTTPDKPLTRRRRINPTPVKIIRPVCSFKNILVKTSESTLPHVSPLQLTEDGEIPVLHLEENHINNLPKETNINDKNLMSLLDTMNISNMECDIPKITCDTAAHSGANFGDGQLNVSPIKGSKPLTFENVISKVTSTPVPKNKCQSGMSGINDSTGCGSFVGGAASVAEKVSDSLTSSNTVSTNVQSSSIRRRRRKCRMVVMDE